MVKELVNGARVLASTQIIFPKTKKDLVVLARQCCLFCLLNS